MDERVTRDLQSIKQFLEDSRKTHLYCDDSFYGCPKHPEYEDEDAVCTCGADAYNEELDKILVKINVVIMLSNGYCDLVNENIQKIQDLVFLCLSSTPPVITMGKGKELLGFRYMEEMRDWLNHQLDEKK